ncbi:TRAP transporter substrate-binding protein [Pseudohalioglobus lutimaris]|uniref:TRAP transporter substrate-binding protein DctP n=1 Tax=Pseudohalioglobus lutimaris TaxID=1737061 RepID=A0A2N5X2I1_9GAMM|nr:TRAP transporter substrate-binding protein [Pseudohalioglobus lutimaris]PLW68688.1 TRAP transporter substrate-binding protein DctP [Pseudohalioglobus lutimaris]
MGEAQQVKRLKLAHSLDTNHPVHQAMEYMAAELDALSQGSMRLEIHPSGQLGGERELIELLQIGSLAMTKVSASPLEGFAPAIKVFSIPYVFRDQDHYWRFLESDRGLELLLSLRSVRLRGLGYYDAGSRSFYMTDKPLHSPTDLQGEKIRVQKSQTSVEMVEALGGAATPIAWGELYTALQQGIVDGAENNPPSFYLSRHYETSKYYTLDEHTQVPDILLVSEHVWQTLQPQQREWLQTAAQASVALQKELWRQATDDALRAVKAAGVTVIVPDKAPFREAVRPMHDSYRGTPAGALLSYIEDLP